MAARKSNSKKTVSGKRKSPTKKNPTTGRKVRNSAKVTKLVNRNIPKEMKGITTTSPTEECCKGLSVNAHVGILTAVAALIVVVACLKACGTF